MTWIRVWSIVRYARVSPSGLKRTRVPLANATERREEANRWRLVRVALDSGAVQATAVVSDSPLGHIDVSPDGSRLAYPRRASISETKVLANVLSALK